MSVIGKGPDFPTGGIILGYDGIRKAYRTGRGSIQIRLKRGLKKPETEKCGLWWTNSVPSQ